MKNLVVIYKLWIRKKYGLGKIIWIRKKIWIKKKIWIRKKI